MDRPPTPLFMPSKSGVDVFTQIEGGDLFDFDAEVEPILEVRAVGGRRCVLWLWLPGPMPPRLVVFGRAA